MKRVLAVLATLASLIQLSGLAFPAGGQESATSADGQLTASQVLELIQSKAHGLKSLTGRFRQVKSTRLLVKSLESEGSFYWQPPQCFRWEVAQPNPFELVTHGDSILIHYPDLQRAKLLRHPLGTGLLGQITGTAGDPEAFQRAYHIEVKPASVAQDQSSVHMSLLPKSGKAGRYLKQIDVDIDTANWLPWQVVIFEVSGDQTTIRLSDLHENTPLPEALFSVEHPSGVQLLPMGGERPQ